MNDFDQDMPEKVTPEDLRQAKLVLAMRMHPGYEVLVQFWDVQREVILKLGRQAAKTKDSQGAASYWMMLDGFEKACSMVEKIAQRADGAADIDTLEKEGKNLAQQ